MGGRGSERTGSHVGDFASLPLRQITIEFLSIRKHCHIKQERKNEKESQKNMVGIYVIINKKRKSERKKNWVRKKQTRLLCKETSACNKEKENKQDNQSTLGIQNLLPCMSTAAATFQFEMSILNSFFFSFPALAP